MRHIYHLWRLLRLVYMQGDKFDPVATVPALTESTNQGTNQGINYHTCAIALGSNLASNLGNSLALVQAALQALGDLSTVQVMEVSRWYSTKAVTLPHSAPQPDYINGCAILQTSLLPHQLLRVLLEIEAQFGRQRRERWGARTLDLDLLLYDDWVLNTTDLIVPHPRMVERAFVLVPLAEIAPHWQHPILCQSMAQLAHHAASLDHSNPTLLEVQV